MSGGTDETGPELVGVESRHAIGTSAALGTREIPSMNGQNIRRPFRKQPTKAKTVAAVVTPRRQPDQTSSKLSVGSRPNRSPSRSEQVTPTTGAQLAGNHL